MPNATVKPVVAPEMEFFPGRPEHRPRQGLWNHPWAGRDRRAAARQSLFDKSAVDEYGPVIDDIYRFRRDAQAFEIDGILPRKAAQARSR